MNDSRDMTFAEGVPERVIVLTQKFPGLWDGLRGAQLFVTGGTGFIGSWILETLALADARFSLGLHVCVLSRDSAAARARLPTVSAHPSFRFVDGDVRDFTFPDGNYSHILHLAAIAASATYHGADPLEQFDIAYLGTRRVLSFAARCGARRFLMTSSGSIYGAPERGMARTPEYYRGAPSPEDVLAAPEHGKRAAEFLLAYHHQKHGLETVVARCFSFIGPGLPLDLHYAAGNFIRDALWGNEIVVRGDGGPIRSYLEIADLLAWLLVMLTRAPGGAVYNVGSDVAVSIGELAMRVRTLLAPGKPLRVLGAHRGSSNRGIYVPDITRAREALGLDVWTPLDNAIRFTAQHALAQRQADT